MIILSMKERFTELLCRFESSTVTDKIWEVVERYYSDGRQYHNLDHIKFCLDQFREVDELAHAKQEVRAAIWFHDIVDDEKESARVAEFIFRMVGIGEISVKHIVDLILVTNCHDNPQGVDQQLIIDCDLAILGQPEGVYIDYTGRLREEAYKSVQDQFVFLRRRFLKAFLERDTIFQTYGFIERYEEAARMNMQNEIDKLK